MNLLKFVGRLCVSPHHFSLSKEKVKLLLLPFFRLARTAPVLHCKVHLRSMAMQPRPPPGYSSLSVSSTQILLPLTISNKCGQSFRWRGVEVYEKVKGEERLAKVKLEGLPHIKKEDEPALVEAKTTIQYEKSIEWSICLNDRVVFVRQDEERGYIYHKTMLSGQGEATNDSAVVAETDSWLSDYLNLRVPLAELYEEWSAKDEVFRRFAKRFTGVRMLRQDPWECLCSFICSSNNNIARIGQMVQNLCTHYSEPLLTYTYPAPPKEVFAGDEEVQMTSNTITYHPFPSPERLAQPDVEEKLRELSFGYRAKYISKTAQMLVEKVSETKADDGKTKKYFNVDSYLHSLRGMSYEQARTELLQFPGVGPKVADCILLMSMDQPSSIPVDRHVFQFAERWYRIKTKGGLKGYEIIAEKFRNLWGPYAGWAHSVLFTADLRAFATYKKEEELVLPMEDGKLEIKEEVKFTIPEEAEVKIEEGEPTFHDNGRPARNPRKRTVEEQASTLTEKFRGVKRPQKRGILSDVKSSE